MQHSAAAPWEFWNLKRSYDSMLTLRVWCIGLAAVSGDRCCAALWPGRAAPCVMALPSLASTSVELKPSDASGLYRASSS